MSGEMVKSDQVIQMALSAGVMNKVDQVLSMKTKLEGSVHLVGPVSQMSSFVEGYGATFTVIKVDSTVSARTKHGPHVYKGYFHAENERGLNKHGLNLLASAMGVKWDGYPESRRVDDGQDPHLCSFTVKGWYRLSDGSLQPITATATCDFRDGSSQMATWTDKQIGGARAKIQERAETIAKERAIKSLGVKETYTVEELEKPFLVVRFAFVPDMSDPAIKQLVTAHHLGATHLLYGAPSHQAAPITSAMPLGALPAPSILTPALGLPDVPPEVLPPAPPEGELIIGAAQESATGRMKFQLERSGWIYTDNREAIDRAIDARNKKVLMVVDFELRDGVKWLIDMTTSGEVA